MAKLKKIIAAFLAFSVIAANLPLSPAIAADITKPTITDSNLSVDPVTGYSTNVSVGINPTFTFSEPMDNTAEGIQNQYSMYLYEVGTTTLISVAKNYDSATNTLTIVPSVTLKENKAYRLTFSGAYFKDMSGNSIAANYDNNLFLLYFSTTGATTDLIPPVLTNCSIADGATGVSTNFSAQLTFNEAMDKSSIESASILEEQGSNSWTYTAAGAVVTYDEAAKTATIKSSSQLKENKNYRLYIKKSSIKDTDGIAMEERVFNFKTGTSDITAPKIVSTSINNGETVHASKKFTVTFDEAIDSIANYTNYISVTKNDQPVDISNWGCSSVDIDCKTLYVPGKYSSVKFDYGSNYKITIKKGIKDLVGNATTEDIVYSFSTLPQDTTPPTITTMTPNLISTDINNPGAVNSLKPAITIKFSEPIAGYLLKPILNNYRISYSNSTDANGNPIWQSLKLADGNTNAYTVTSDCADTVNYTTTFTTLTITPLIDLTENTKYQLYAVASDLDGNALAKNEYYFTPKLGNTTDTTPPTIVSTYPEKKDYLNRPMDIPLDMKATVKFSEAMDQNTLNSDNIYLTTVGLNPKPVAANLSYDSTTFTATITPSQPLEQLTDYALVVENVQDTAHNTLAAEYDVDFKTVQTDFTGPVINSVYPAENATNVAIDKPFTVTFNEPIDFDGNIFNNNITVKEGENIIPPSKVSGDGGVVFSYGSDSTNIKISLSKSGSYIWKKGTKYTITVEKGVLDQYKNPMLETNEKTWSFNTIEDDTTRPEITSMVPNIISGTEQNPVVLNTLRPEFSVAFNEPMNGMYIKPINDYIAVQYYLSDSTGGAWYDVKLPGEISATTITSNGSDITSFTQLKISLLKDLESNKLYRLHLVAGDMQYNTLDKTDYYFMPKTGDANDNIPPTVVDSYPKKVDYLNRPTDIDPAATFTVKFSEAMDEKTITSENVYIGSIDALNGGIIKTPATVTYDPITYTATVKPINALAQNQDYALTADNVFDLAGNKITSEWEADFKTAITDKTGPVIVGTYPEENATGVAFDKDFSITFNKSLNYDCNIFNSNVIVQEDGVVIPPSMKGGDNGITFSLENGNILKIRRSVAGSLYWKKGSTYTITVKGDIVDTLGNKMNTEKTWSFKILEADTTIPVITSMTPDITSGTQDSPVFINTVRPEFKVTFSEPMAGSFINPINGYVQFEYYLSDSTGGAWYAVHDSNGNSATIVTSNGSSATSFTELTIGLNQDLDPAKQYRLHLVAGDLQYNTINKTDYYFTLVQNDDKTPPTVASVCPANNASDAALDVKPQIVFSEKINALDVTTDNFALYKGTQKVDAVVTYDSNLKTVTIEPKNILDADTQYTIAVEANISDLAGNKLAEKYTSSFTTGKTVQQTAAIESVYSIADNGDRLNITNGGTEVPTSVKFEVLFNQLMDENTIKVGNTENIYITANSDGTRDVENTAQVVSKITTEGTKTKVVLEGIYGMSLALYSGRNYYLVISNAVKDKNGNGFIKTIIPFETIAPNKIEAVTVDNVVINSGVTVVAPVEASMYAKKISILASREILSDGADYAIKLWQENGTAYGALVSAPVFVSGKSAYIDLSNITLKENGIYKVQIKSDLLSVDGSTLDKDYYFWFKAVSNPTIVKDGKVNITGNNIVKKDEETTLTISTDIKKVKTMNFKLLYDTKEVSVLTSELADIFKDKNVQLTVSKNADGTEKGEIVFNANLDSEVEVLDLFKLKVKSLNGNRTEINFDSDIVTYTKGDNVPKFAAAENLVIMGKTYDLNADGVVNILDVLMVTRMIGLDSSSEEFANYKGRDINEDGKIDETDADLLCEHLGETSK